MKALQIPIEDVGIKKKEKRGFWWGHAWIIERSDLRPEKLWNLNLIPFHRFSTRFSMLFSRCFLNPLGSSYYTHGRKFGNNSPGGKAQLDDLVVHQAGTMGSPVFCLNKLQNVWWEPQAKRFVTPPLQLFADMWLVLPQEKQTRGHWAKDIK